MKAMATPGETGGSLFFLPVPKVPVPKAGVLLSRLPRSPVCIAGRAGFSPQSGSGRNWMTLWQPISTAGPRFRRRRSSALLLAFTMDEAKSAASRYIHEITAAMLPFVLAHLADDQTGTMRQPRQARVGYHDRLHLTLEEAGRSKEEAGQSKEAACAFAAARLVSAGLFLRDTRSHDVLMEAMYEA